MITETHVILGIVGALSSLNSACLAGAVLPPCYAKCPQAFSARKRTWQFFSSASGSQNRGCGNLVRNPCNLLPAFLGTGDIETLLISILIQPEPSKIPLAEIPVTCSTRHARCPTLVCSSLHKVAQKDCAFYSRPGTSQTGTV